MNDIGTLPALQCNILFRIYFCLWIILQFLWNFLMAKGTTTFSLFLMILVSIDSIYFFLFSLIWSWKANIFDFYLQILIAYSTEPETLANSCFRAFYMIMVSLLDLNTVFILSFVTCSSPSNALYNETVRYIIFISW